MFSEIFAFVRAGFFNGSEEERGQRSARKMDGVALTPLERTARSQQIFDAFDIALQKIAQTPPLAGRKLTIADGRAAVKASHFACGPTARAAEAWLHNQGLTDVRFHSLKGHYVLLDERTSLLHDAETPEGVCSKYELPIWSRTVALVALVKEEPSEHSHIFEQYAAMWLAKFPGPWSAGSQTISCENKKGVALLEK